MAIPIERMHTSQRMSKIVTHNETIYLCGQVGNRGASIEAQTTEALSRVDALLAEAGSSKKHLLQRRPLLERKKTITLNYILSLLFRALLQP